MHFSYIQQQKRIFARLTGICILVKGKNYVLKLDQHSNRVLQIIPRTLYMHKLTIFWVVHCRDLGLLRPEAATVGCCRRQQHP